MKSVSFFIIITLFLVTTSPANAQQGNKVVIPEFNATTAETICKFASIGKFRQSIHVVSSAGWSGFQNIGLRIVDNTTQVVIKVYDPNTAPITGDFTTVPLSLVEGRTYRVEFLNSYSQVFQNQVKYIVAQSCIKKVGNVKTQPDVRAFKPE